MTKTLTPFKAVERLTKYLMKSKNLSHDKARREAITMYLDEVDPDRKLIDPEFSHETFFEIEEKVDQYKQEFYTKLKGGE